MADANKGTAEDPAGGLKTPSSTPAGVARKSAPNTPVQEPEATIIEETITRPAPLESKRQVSQIPQPELANPGLKTMGAIDSPTGSAPAKPVPQPTPPATPLNPAIQKPEERKIPPPPLDKEPQPSAAAPSTPSPEKVAPPAPVIGNLIPPELKSAAPPVSVPPPAPPSPVVPKPPLSTPPVPTQPPETEAMRTDIEHLLKDIKLPERRESPNMPNAGSAVPVRTYDTLLGGALAGEGERAPHPEAVETGTNTIPSKQVPPEKIVPDKTPSSAPLHTLKSDLQEIVRVKKISLVSAVALEQDKRRGSVEAEARAVPARSGRTFGVLFAAGLLVVLGTAALFGVYTIMRERAGTTPAATLGSSILFAETAVSLPLSDISSLDLKRLLAQVRAGGSATLGSITNIIPVVSVRDEEGVEVESPASLGDFLAALDTRASPDLLRALGSEFFLGLHTVDENAPLLVIPVVSYERAFAGMLAWEGTINADFSPFFTPVPDQIAGPGGLPQKRRFEDLVMRNYDVRALKNDTGRIELYYSFPTQDILIIGESPYSFTEILSRLRAERKL